ncbi:hypothetical protein [Actinacidiphila sp. bgisy160]|uniref:hypothetical protein n=1 Tax=Actinacidiphila sp. bgisy160 TaxID=3413796 RepID=UPI003D749B58
MSESARGLLSELIDLSDFRLDDLGGMTGLEHAWGALRSGLMRASAPLCEGSIAPGYETTYGAMTSVTTIDLG